MGYYDNSSFFNQTLIEQWNGTSWVIISSPNTSSSQHNYLNSVTCASASECWAVGVYNNGSVNQTLIEQWNGASWEIIPSPNTSSSQDNYLQSVTCTSTSDCWAVGFYIADIYPQTLIEQWNGTSWAIISSPTNNNELNQLNGVTCTSASQCWAVGTYQVPPRLRLSNAHRAVERHFLDNCLLAKRE